MQDTKTFFFVLETSGEACGQTTCGYYQVVQILLVNAIFSSLSSSNMSLDGFNPRSENGYADPDEFFEWMIGHMEMETPAQ
jgi:hypothetical protein